MKRHKSTISPLLDSGRADFDSLLDEELGKLTQELSKHDISLRPDDPILLIPRMNAVMGRHLVRQLEESRKHDHEMMSDLIRQQAASFKDQRTQVAQDTSKMVQGMRKTLGEALEVKHFAGHAKTAVSNQVVNDLRVTLDKHLAATERAIAHQLYAQDTAAHRRNLAWAGGIGAILMGALLFCIRHIDDGRTSSAIIVHAYEQVIEHIDEACEEHRHGLSSPPLPPEIVKRCEANE